MNISFAISIEASIPKRLKPPVLEIALGMVCNWLYVWTKKDLIAKKHIGRIAFLWLLDQ